MLRAIFIQPLVFLIEVFQAGFSALGFPYTYGFAIIGVTLFLRLIMLPLTLKSMASMRRMQELQPHIEALKKKHGKDQQKLLAEQQALYKEAGVSPLGGCLPMLIQFPILFGFYYAVRELAENGRLVNQAFFWIPNLAFPDVSTGLSWLWPLPPSAGWDTAIRYLVLPILLVISQVAMQMLSMASQSSTSDNPQAKMMNQMMWVMSLMFFYITLTVPAGLSLYWVTSNVLGVAQQWYVNRRFKTGKEPVAVRSTKGAEAPALATAGGGAVVEGQVLESADPDGKGSSRRREKSRKRKRKKR